MNILEAYKGPFSTWLGEPSEWATWQTFIKSLAGVPLSDEEVPLFQKCTGRTVPFSQPVSEAWVVAGRRARKSAVAATIGVHAAVFRDWSKCIAPGETARVLIVAVTKDQAKLIHSYARAILQSHPTLEAMVASVDQESINLENGIQIVCVANSFRSIRGPAVVCALFEELAYWRSEESATPDKEVLRAVKPSMLTTKKHGALLIGISSPYAKRGLLYEKHKEHFGNNESNVLVWQADSRTMNPTLDEKEIEDAYKDDPQSAASEFGALFRDDIQNFLDADLISKLTRTSPLELPPVKGVAYKGFVDPSGGRGDSFTIAIAHADKDGKAILDLVRGTPPPFNPEKVVQEYAHLLREYRLLEVTGDFYAAEWVSQTFKAQGIRYNQSKGPKSAIYLEALPLFTQGQVELPDLRPLLLELAQLERRTARGGKDSVDHPPRAHDDLANSACGALVLAATTKKRYPPMGPGGASQKSAHNID